jgi:alpha-ketoglutarate-dependent taurine dioxygenase
MHDATEMDFPLKPWPREPKTGWVAADLNREVLAFDLGRPQLEALRDLVSQVVRAGTPLSGISRRDFRHPALEPFMDKVADHLKRGSGLTFLRGVEVDDFSTDELRVLFVGLGSYFGRPVSQSKFGDMMGEVTPVAGRENDKRGYVVDRALSFHIDHSEIFGLFCIVDALEGGENVFVSTLKIHEIIRSEHPEYLPILERGWRLWLVDEQPLDVPSVTPHRVPIFASVDGVLSGIGGLRTVERCAEALGEPISDAEKAAIQFGLAVRDRPELHFEASLAPGEAVFVNNFEILHARKAVTHRPDRKRHLLRLWLEGEAESGRPLPAAYPIYRFMNKSGRQGIDPLPPRELEQQIEACKQDPTSQFMRALSL